MARVPSLDRASGELRALVVESNTAAPVIGPALAGNFKIDCTTITLSSSSGAEVASGPGYIAQTPPDGFHVTIFLPGPLLAANERAVPPPGSLQAGSHALAATDIFGRTWSAACDQPNPPSGCIGGRGHTLRAHCFELVLCENGWPSDAKDNRVEVWSRGELRLPNAANDRRLLPIIEGPAVLGQRERRVTVVANGFEDRGYEFAIFHHGGNTCLRVLCNEPPPAHLASRLWESMLFTLGGPLAITAIRTVTGGVGELRIRPPEPPTDGRTFAPIDTYSGPPTGFEWEIFRRYLRYVLSGDPPPDGQLHPLSARVFGVRKSEGLSVNAQSSSLSVAVEAVVDLIPNLAAVSGEDQAALRKLRCYIKRWPDSNSGPRERARNRATGFIGSAMGNPSARDSLRQLCGLGAVSGANVDAWRELRNAAAHGDWSGLQHDQQGWFDRLGAVRTLFHEIVFHIIGYQGQYTDYGQVGFPLLDHPRK
ncbi:MAG: hypothetical protein ACP5O1_06140 [Phycisphaerae bacterium]